MNSKCNSDFVKEIESILERNNFSYEQKIDIRDMCNAIISYVEDIKE